MRIFGMAMLVGCLGFSSAWAQEVNVVMQDQSLMRGDLIGINDGLLYLKNGEGRVEAVGTSRVSQVFDAASGAKVPFAPAAAPVPAPAATAPDTAASSSAPAAVVKPLLFIHGTLDSGMVGYVPCQPLEGAFRPGAAYVNGMLPYDSAWGAGLGAEYRFWDFLSGSVDFGLNRWEKLLAKENGYGVGDWAWEKSGYTDARVGPFPMDVTYYMDTTSLRLGAKYYPLARGIFQPFLGAALGLYAWQATIGNRGKEKKYSETASGTVVSPTFSAGLDFVLDEFTIRLFGDFAAPVANPRFENLFYQGWTFENTGGEHLAGPYRFGIALGMAI